jgi:hypothetical protein
MAAKNMPHRRQAILNGHSNFLFFANKVHKNI